MPIEKLLLEHPLHHDSRRIRRTVRPTRVNELPPFAQTSLTSRREA